MYIEREAEIWDAQVGLGSLEMNMSLLTTTQGTAGRWFLQNKGLVIRVVGSPNPFGYL